MNDLFNPLTVLWTATTPMEIMAIFFSILSVFLTNIRFKSLYPIGILGTLLFFFVFWQAKLYASAGLQIYFTLIQLYGWWFWSKGGNEGKEPAIGNWSWKTIGLLLIPTTLITIMSSHFLNIYTDANMALWDTLILCLSVLAQFLLDRKQQKHWIIWAIVNVISIYVYSTQNLWLTSATYVLLLLNIPVGWYLWKNAQINTDES